VTDEKGEKMQKELVMIALLHVTKMMHIIFYTSLNSHKKVVVSYILYALNHSKSAVLLNKITAFNKD